MTALITTAKLEEKLQNVNQNIPYPMGSGPSDPTPSEIPPGKFTMWKNTSNGEIRMWVNEGGAMKKSTTLT